MGYAKPIIASDMSPFSEEIEHLRHGILFPPKDSTRLRDAIERLSLDSKLCEDIRANLEELGKKRSWEAVASQTGELYSAILNGDAQ